MPDPKDQHDQYIIPDFVDDPIHADTDSQGIVTGKLFAIRRTGISG